MLGHVSQNPGWPDDLLRRRTAILPPWNRRRHAFHRRHVWIASRRCCGGPFRPQAARNRSRLADQSRLIRTQRGILSRCVFVFRTPPLRPPPDQPPRRQHSHSHQNPPEAVSEKLAGQRHNLRTEPECQQRLNQKTHEPSRKNCQQKTREVHLERRRCQHHNLERRGRRQHCRKHQRPEFMVIEGFMNLLEALRRKPLAQQHLATRIADDVQNDASERRPGRAQQHIHQKPRAVVVNVAHENRIQRQAHERAVHCRKREHPPRPQRRKNVLDPLAVSVDKMFDLVQVGKISLREKRNAVVSRWSLVVSKPIFCKLWKRLTTSDRRLILANDHRPSTNDRHAPSFPQSTPAHAAANPSPLPAIRPPPPDCPAG